MYYLGVDVGGTNIAVGVVDENNAIIAKASQKTPVPCSEEVFCDKIVEVCSEALGKANLTFDDVPWIGIGCPVFQKFQAPRDDGRAHKRQARHS